MSAEERDAGKPPSVDEGYDPDDYIRTAVTYGRLDLIKDWVPHQREHPERVSELVLCPAAMYGQLEVLEFALDYGNIQYREEKHPLYCGWNLLHFAVEGIHMNVPDGDSKSENQTGALLEIHSRLLDVVALLAKQGVMLDHNNSDGQTPAEKASTLTIREECFLDGALLIDIFATRRAAEKGEQQAHTPGLETLRKLSSEIQWKLALQPLIEWAYSRKQYDVLIFCHMCELVDITSEDVIIGCSGRPLMIDAIHQEDYTIIRKIIDSQPEKQKNQRAQDILTKVYTYGFGNLGKLRESLISYACREYLDGNRQILPALLSPQMAGNALTHIKIEDISLYEIPIALFNPRLKVLEMKGNGLTALPISEANKQGLCEKLTSLTVSENSLFALPEDLFRLPSLVKLNASGNQIEKVPAEMWTAPVLKDLNLSRNRISRLPCPSYVHLEDEQEFVCRKSFSHLLPISSPSQAILLVSTRQAYFKSASKLSSEAQQLGFGLTNLDLSSNRLSIAPRGLPCLAPLLKLLKLNSNCITHLGHLSDYPSTLITLDVSKNAAVQCIQPSPEPPKVVCIQSQLEHKSGSCFHFSHTSLSKLKFLYLNHNQLTNVLLETQAGGGRENTGGDMEEEGRGRKRGGSGGGGGGGGGEQPIKELLFPQLQSLRLSNNQLQQVPQSVHKHKGLCELAIDGNLGISHIPSNLHNLTQLFVLKYTGVSDPVVDELKRFETAQQILIYLKTREKNYCPNTSMRLYTVGNAGTGKTTVLSYLRQGKRLSFLEEQSSRKSLDCKDLQQQTEESIASIQCDRWLCRRPGASKHSPSITFYTWDFAGQEEYYLTQQCFFINRALYLLVWDVRDDLHGIESLSVWLQDLHTKAPSSSVIVVGTHLDEIARQERDLKCSTWRTRILERQEQCTDNTFKMNIIKVHFVGIPKRGKTFCVEELADVVYDIAMNMDVPRDGQIMQHVRIRIMEEWIPEAYERLRRRVDKLMLEGRKHAQSPIIPKDLFWSKVKDIDGLEEESIDAAVTFLHNSTGVVLHFNLPVLVDYYIIDPQRWFELCALVISPNNVSKLIRSARKVERGNGQLVTALMDRELESQGHSKDTGRLVRAFLQEHAVIHQLDSDSFLIPTVLSSEPPLPLEMELGFFPFKESHMMRNEQTEENEGGEKGEGKREGALVSSTSTTISILSYKKPAQRLHIVKTGLVFRRTLFLPPIASGFWSKLISLFILKEEFFHFISTSAPQNYAMQVGNNHLRGMIGNVTIEWHYWKTGILLLADDQLLMRVSSFRREVFEDPKQQSSVSSSQKKVELLQYAVGKEWKSVPRHFNEVIEMIAPVAILTEEETAPPHLSRSTSLSAKLLAKALEIVDEVLKNHSKPLAMNGIYTVRDMLHLIPCPICYGDTDQRVSSVSSPVGTRNAHPFQSLPAERKRRIRNEPHRSGTLVESQNLYSFNVDECIMQASLSDCINCPRHGNLEICYLAPDVVFADLAHVRLDRRNLNQPIDLNEETNLRGSFGKVVRRTLHKEGSKGPLEIAIKIFEQFDSVEPGCIAEQARNYADMRYELNKLSTLKHTYIVHFVGVFTNPLCFVLEWAPEKSLEHIRQAHKKNNNQSICPTSLFLILLQVTDALSYLHDEANIIHNDLRCSNILVFKFPPIGHDCLKGTVDSGCALCFPDEEDCSVLVKVADMGICVNPATQKTKNMQGIRQLIPECLNFDAALTEKADIFSLGSCLYEIMTLSPLPPRSISEAEYRNMLSMGKRPSFSLENTIYPAFLYQLLEECWLQEHFRRPSASLLHTALATFTGLMLRDGAPAHTTRCLLLDTFQLHQSSRVSAIHSLVTESSFHMSAALSSPDEDHTSIMKLSLHQSEGFSRMEAKPLWEFRNNRVSVIHSTSDGVVLAALPDGQVMIFSPNGMCSFSEPIKRCFEFAGEHGEIVALQYLPQPRLLVMGFDMGKVHIYHCPESIRDTLTSDTKQYCAHLIDMSSLYSIRCLLPPSGGSMEVWCGTDCSAVEVWSLQLRPGMQWVAGEVDKEESVIPIHLPSASRNVTVKQMELNYDSTCVVALLHQPGSHLSSLTFVDVASKTILQSVICGKVSVASFTMSPTKLIVGTYNGLVHIFGLQEFLLGSPCALDMQRSEVLQAHHKSVYSIAWMRGDIDKKGYTSLCPTFMGKTGKKAVPREFLVSVGYGRHSLKFSSVFQSFVQQRGVCLNVWII